MSVWHEPRALCRTEGHPSDWDDSIDGYPETESVRNERHNRAKAVCRRCPVRRGCEDNTDLWSDSGIRFGIHLEKWREGRTTSSAADSLNAAQDERRSA